MPLTPRQRYNSRWSGLQQARSPWDASWQEIGDYLSPWRTRFNESERNQRRAANDKILDPTGTYALRTCGAGMSSGFCSATRDWSRYAPPAALLARYPGLAQKPEIKRYIAECEAVDRDILLRSNFYGVTSGYAFRDLPAFGIFGMFAEEHWRTVATFKPMPLGQYWLAADANGEVDEIYRRYTLTVAQMVKEFGLAACSSRVQDQYRRNQLDVEHTIMHVVEPNRADQETGFEGMRSGRFDWRGMDFRSVTYEQSFAHEEAGGFLRVSGYRDFPAITPRWARTSPEDVYGTGAGHEVLPDVKQLQTATRRKLQLIEKSAIPPLKGNSEISGMPSQHPGAFTRVPGSGDASGRLEPIFLPNPSAITEVRADIGELRWAIQQGLFADLWRLMTDDERNQRATAEEIRAKKEERLNLLGPVSSNVEQEYLRRVLDRVFALAERRGLHPDPPEELAGQELKVEFISIFGEAQKAQEIPAVERVANFINSLAQIDGEVLDTMDCDKFAQKYAEIAGLPPDLLRSPEAIAAIRQARAEKEQAKAMGEAIATGSGAVKDLAGAGLESESALSRIIGTLGPVAANQALAGQQGALA